jgi:predicted N-acetyltransferase YhbS
MIEFSPAVAADAAAIDALLDTNFGPARHLRTASLLRAGSPPLAGPTMVARANGVLAGSVQYTPVRLMNADGREKLLTLLGPIVVAEAARCCGVGGALMRRSLAVHDALHGGAVVLIGDPEYYERFGFSAAPTTGWHLPGPVERRRLLARVPADTVLPAVGDLVPARSTLRLAA